MTQLNSFLSGLNLAVTGKFQIHVFFVLFLSVVTKKFVIPGNNSNYGNSNKKRE